MTPVCCMCDLRRLLKNNHTSSLPPSVAKQLYHSMTNGHPNNTLVGSIEFVVYVNLLQCCCSAKTTRNVYSRYGEA